MGESAGHAFISYVREDSGHVDQLQESLESAGISVWRDTASLWPGEDWGMKIRQAISENALVFIACFSGRSTAKTRSNQNMELWLAIEQLQQRRLDEPWLIPVRFDDCRVPDLPLGGGRTLKAIHRVDLFGDRRDAEVERLVTAVRRLLMQQTPDQDTLAKRAAPEPSMATWAPAQPGPHEDLAPLAFLLGRWQGAGVGGYPTIESFRFGQEISFSHNGKPYLIYASRTWLLDADGKPGRPLAMETGFWRLKPMGKLEVLLTHATGITEIYLGEVVGTKIEIATDLVASTESAKEVRAGRRLYGLIGADLAYAFDMEAVGQQLQAHISAQLKRVAAA